MISSSDLKYSKLMWSNDNQQAETPPEVWKTLEEEFGKMYDPCPPNYKINGLVSEWKSVNYVNPPYNECGTWMEKVITEYKKGKKCICLIPARSHTNWFHEWVIPYVTELRFVQNGVRFVGYRRKSPFSICIAIFDPAKKGTQSFCGQNFYGTKQKRKLEIDCKDGKSKKKMKQSKLVLPLPPAYRE